MYEQQSAKPLLLHLSFDINDGGSFYVHRSFISLISLLPKLCVEIHDCDERATVEASYVGLKAVKENISQPLHLLHSRRLRKQMKEDFSTLTDNGLMNSQ